MNKFFVLLVFSHQQSPCTWSLPCLYEHDTLQAKYGKVSWFSKFLQVKVLNLSNQKSNSKPRQVWWKKVTSPLEASSQESSSSEQTEVSMNFTRRSPVQRTYNTEPLPNDLAWGEALPCIQVSILFPFCFSF